MKCAILGDIHFKKIKTDTEKKYRERVLYFVSQTLKEKNVKNVIQLGDFFDDRRNLDLSVYNETCEQYEKYFGFIDHFISLAGNHDVYFKNTNDVCSTKILEKHYANFIALTDSHETSDSLFIPWINESNIERFSKILETSKHKYCFGHFEINSFNMIKGIEETNGLSIKTFRQFKKVFSGHFHLTQDNWNISYVGSLFQNDRNDVNDIKRFFILDTETDELEEIRIPFELFKRVTIASEDDMNDELIESFNECIADVVFNMKASLKREKFIDRIIEESKGNFEYQIIDNSQLCQEAIELNANNEEITEIFSDYLKISDTIDDERKTALSNLFTDVYREIQR